MMTRVPVSWRVQGEVYSHSFTLAGHGTADLGVAPRTSASRSRRVCPRGNVAGMGRRVIPLVDFDPLYSVTHGFIGPDLSVSKTQMILLPASCLDWLPGCRSFKQLGRDHRKFEVTAEYYPAVGAPIWLRLPDS